MHPDSATLYYVIDPVLVQQVQLDERAEFSCDPVLVKQEYSLYQPNAEADVG